MNAQNKNTDAASMRNRLICSLDSYGINNEGKMFEDIAAIGFKTIEISCSQTRPYGIVPDRLFDFNHNPGGAGHWGFSLPDLKERIHSFGLKAGMMNASCELCHPRSVEWLRRRIDAAGLLGIDVLSTGIGQGWRDAGAESLVADHLRMACLYARERGKTICVKTEAWLANGPEETLRLLDEAGSERLKVDFDPSLILHYNPEVNVLDYLEKIIHAVGCVHLRGIMKKDGLSALPEAGAGAINYQKMFSLLNENGFYGPFCLELDYAYFWEPNSDQIPLTHASWLDGTFDREGLRERGEKVRQFMRYFAEYAKFDI